MVKKGLMIMVNNDVIWNVFFLKKISLEVRREFFKRLDMDEDNEIVILNLLKELIYFGILDVKLFILLVLFSLL